jgi:hypothetical protein
MLSWRGSLNDVVLRCNWAIVGQHGWSGVGAFKASSCLKSATRFPWKPIDCSEEAVRLFIA